MKPIVVLFYGILLNLLFIGNLSAQNDLDVSYVVGGIPDILNICGEPDTVKVKITNTGINSNTRTKIVVNLQLAGGIRMESIIANESTVGVQLVSGQATGTAQFSIPDMDPNGLNEVLITFLARADCSINDKLTADPAYDLKDNWTINYEINNTTSSVSTTLNSYRAALRIPEFVVSTSAINQKLKASDCVTRTVLINNTSLDAHTLGMVYKVNTSSALSYKAIRVNGIDAPITKTIGINGDTIITIDLTGTQFINNQGATANNDNLFDSGEELVIEEDICIANCSNPFSTTHTASYGCYATTCTEYTKDANLEQGQGTVNIIFDTISQVNVGYCKTGISEVKIKNIGVAVDPGFADIYNIEPGIGMGNPTALSADGYTITSIAIQGITFNDASVKKVLDGNAAFQVDPDGPGGLSDLDGDGYFDDLAAGDSIIIKVEYDFNCSASNFDLSTNCDTAFVTHLSTYLGYVDPCNIVQEDTWLNYMTISNIGINPENYTTPDTEAGSGDIFYLKHVQNRIFFNFDQGCTNGNYYVQMVLPQGISLVEANTTLKRPFINHALVSSTMSNDTLTILFAPSATESMIGKYELNLAFTADCNAQDGPVNMLGEIGYKCPDCSCKHIWYCANITGTYVHVKNPPCPTAPSCDNTIRTETMDMSRTTFGFTDATYATPIDPLMANAKSALNCDTMKLTLDGLAGAAYNGTNIGIDMSYANPLYELGTDDIFVFGRGHIEVVSGATTKTCQIPKSSLTTTPVDPFKKLDFNLEASLQGCGITIQPNDQVKAHLYFVLNENGPYPSQFYLVPELKAGFYVNNAAKIKCGTYGDQVKIGKNTALATSPNQNALPQGCDTAFLTYKLIPIFTVYDEEFPNEHRPAISVDSISFNYDALRLHNGFEDLRVQASFFNHPFYGNEFYDVGTLDNSGHFVATFDTLYLLPSLVDINKAAFKVRIIAVPKCESLRGGGGGSLPLNKYPFEMKFHYKSNYHVFNISNGSCLKDSTYANTNNISYSNPPEIAIDNLGSPTEIANGKVFTWNVRHCNTTSYADAKFSWLSIEDISTPINILKMEDITDPGNIINLPVIDDGTGGFYANTNGLLRASGSNSSNDICNIISITGELTDCGEVTATVRSGWNCTAFDQTTHNFCPEAELIVKAKNAPPQLDIIQTSGAIPTAFCAVIPVEYEIKNTQLGRYYDMNFDFSLPQDLKIVPGSFKVAWPKSAPFVALGSEPTYINSTIFGDNYTVKPFTPFAALVANGLNQVNTVMPNDSNTVVVQFEILSDCGYSSGRSSQLNIYGSEFCGNITDTTGFTSFPYFILGSEPDPANKYKIEPTLPDIITGQFPVDILITNVGDSIAGPKDKFIVLLPQGIEYIANSATATGWTVGEPNITVDNGITTLEWLMPQGLTNGNSKSFNFNLTSDAIGCASMDFPIAFMSIREKDEFCAATNNTCTVDIITSPLDVHNIHKKGSPIVNISANVPNSLCSGLPVELVAQGFDDITWTVLPSGDTIGTGTPLFFTPSLNQTDIIASATGDACPVSSDTLTVNVLESPTVTLPEDFAITTGDTVQINGAVTTNIPTVITWTPNTTLSDATIENPLVFPTTTTTYVIAAAGNTGCTAIDSITLTVNPKIDTVPCPIFNINTDAANYIVVCGMEANFPLNMDFALLGNYNIMVDGVKSNDLVSEFIDSVGMYNIPQMVTQTGPFDITWEVNNKSYQGSVADASELVNQLAIWDKFGNWYFDNINLWGGAAFHTYGNLTITNGSGFELDAPFGKTRTYGGSQLALGSGTYELIIFDTLNVCADTVNLTVSCEDYNPNTPTTCVTELIYINQEMSFDFGAILPGKIVSFTDICANPSATAVDYVYNDSTEILDYVGMEIGSDSACVIVCDEFGLCDTVSFCTEVIEYNGLPTANSDSICTLMNLPVVIDILANDTTWGGIDTMYFVNTSLNGDLVLNPDYTITFTPYDEVCDRDENIQYIVCNDNGCADAFVNICIKCDDIKVFTAVSPNGDGANDVFYIANIEKYPNNVVEVYNRWGNRVYQGIGYTNDWDGNWVTEKIIPDGTYFYVIRLNDKDNRVLKGHLEIRR